MEDEEGGEEPVEEVVGRKHLHDLGCLDRGAVQYPGRVHAKSEEEETTCPRSFAKLSSTEAHLVTIQMMEKHAKRTSQIR